MTGLMDGADPTAPGGMSKAALREELTTLHGYMDIEVDSDAMTWPDLIDAVAQGRLAREAEAKEQAENPPLFLGMPDTNDYIFSGHAGASPSGAERWMHCTKSLGMARKFLETLTPRQAEAFASGNGAARQGTTAHAAGAAELDTLRGEITPAERDAVLLELAIMPADGEEYDIEMAEHVQMYVDLVSQFIEERGEANVLIESHLEAAVWLTGAHGDEDPGYHVIPGSGDTVALPSKPGESLAVVDYKHGEGIDVSVDENPQIRIYGLGALALLVDDDGNLTMDGDDMVHYFIVQPRNGGIKEWTETVNDLLTWRDDVLAPALTAALYDDAEAPASFAPSDSVCQWCPAKGACPALTDQRMAAATDLFDVIVEAEFNDGPGAFPETDTLDNDALGSLLTQINGLVKIQEDLKEEAQRRLHRGEKVAGFKMVGYTPPRKWTADAAEELADVYPAIYIKKMLTPKQALALVQSEVGDGSDSPINIFIETPGPRPVIAAEGDRRKEWTGTPPEQMFSDMDGDSA